jgi:hypothetical protein
MSGYSEQSEQEWEDCKQQSDRAVIAFFIGCGLLLVGWVVLYYSMPAPEHPLFNVVQNHTTNSREYNNG